MKDGRDQDAPRRIAVIGAGISGLSAAWLLSRHHQVTLFEQEARLGGHSNTVSVPADGGSLAIDTGFIVYNQACYPNLTALFAHLGVETIPSEMSFAVSLRGGALEYGGGSLATLFAQKRNLLRPRFWSMLNDLRRFYRDAPGAASTAHCDLTLGELLDLQGCGSGFVDDHLLPMAAAIWSAPAETLRAYPASAFIRFCDNHGLLRISDRPIWRTVRGGARVYVERMAAEIDRGVKGGGVQAGNAAIRVRREPGRAGVLDMKGDVSWFDDVIIATHADTALALLEDADDTESKLLGAFAYSRNLAVLHTDPALMPRRRRVWSSWNYIGLDTDDALCVTYWMNRLQSLPGATPYLLTLNPPRPPAAGSLLCSELYHHPIFDAVALRAQRALWRLQGQRRTWFCGAYFGSGFHEDGLQSGLAVAEAIGGVRRPWQVAAQSGRIQINDERGEASFAFPSASDVAP